MRLKSFYTLLIFAVASLAACTQIDLFEKLNNIPNAEWKRDDIQRVELNIADSTQQYRVFVVMRHDNQYAFRNIWINLGIQQPGDSTIQVQPFELQLAASDKWLGTGMGDVFERRILLFPKPVRFPKTGKIVFTLQQNMRVDPLPHIFQTGIRIEPVP